VTDLGARALRFMNKTRGEGYKIRNSAEDTSVTEILLYDEVGGWFGVMASDFVKDLQDVDTAEIHLRINSPGGDVFDGIAIMNALKRHKAKVTTFVDGIAASAASFIAMSGDEIVMSRNAEMMIHDAWGLAVGNAADMRDLADRLDASSENIASIYADRAGGTTKQWRTAMESETWYSDKEAVSAGLADRVETNKTASDKAKNRFDLSVFAHAGRASAPDPWINNKTPAEPPETPNQEGSDMSDTLNLRERLGLKADASDEEVTAKLDALVKNSEAPAEEPDETPDEEETEEAAPAAAPGTVLVDEDQFNALKAAAEQGQQARAQQLAEHRNTLVANAVADGRISPARKADWLATLEADPGAEATLNALPKGLVPIEAKGYTGSLGEAGESADDALYNSLYGTQKES
jgi:ATP-dependent Clp endopeptidase proteolytic subunit ClpP